MTVLDASQDMPPVDMKVCLPMVLLRTEFLDSLDEPLWSRIKVSFQQRSIVMELRRAMESFPCGFRSTIALYQDRILQASHGRECVSVLSSFIEMEQVGNECLRVILPVFLLPWHLSFSMPLFHSHFVIMESFLFVCCWLVAFSAVGYVGPKACPIRKLHLLRLPRIRPNWPIPKCARCSLSCLFLVLVDMCLCTRGNKTWGAAVASNRCSHQNITPL